MLLLGRKNSLERVAAFLLEMDRRHSGTGVLALPMSRRDIADYLGLALETVSRELSHLRALGILRLAASGRLCWKTVKSCKGSVRDRQLWTDAVRRLMSRSDHLTNIVDPKSEFFRPPGRWAKACLCRDANSAVAATAESFAWTYGCEVRIGDALGCDAQSFHHAHDCHCIPHVTAWRNVAVG
jgi:hypothetical protein